MAKVLPYSDTDCFTPIPQKPIALRYAITPRVLGTGSYGTVWLAWDKKQGRQVACKTQSKEEMTGQEAL